MERIVLENGLRLLLLPLPENRVFSLDVWVSAGSRYEQGYHGGISHLAEHMVFKGTHSRSSLEISLAADAIGGAVNAYTSAEYTRYYVQTLGEYAQQALELVTDMLLHPAIPQRELELEQQVVLEEIAMYEDSPEDAAHDNLTALVWPGDPLGAPISGTRESVSAITREELQRFLRKNYTPERMLVVCAGDFDRDRVVETVCRDFGNLPAGGGKPRADAPAFQPGIALRQKENEQVCMELGFPGLSSGSDERFALTLLNVVLGDGESSRLYQRLREELGLVYSVYAANCAGDGAGVYAIAASTTADNQLTVLEEIGGVLRRLLEEGISEEELTRAKLKAKTGFIMSQETVAARGVTEGRNEQLFGRRVSVEEVLSAWERVTAADVVALARRIFGHTPALSAVGPVLAESEYRAVLDAFPGGSN